VSRSFEMPSNKISDTTGSNGGTNRHFQELDQNPSKHVDHVDAYFFACQTVSCYKQAVA